VKEHLEKEKIVNYRGVPGKCHVPYFFITFPPSLKLWGAGGCNPKWREGYSGRRIALCEEEMEVQFGAQGSDLIDFHHLYTLYSLPRKLRGAGE
jgi:hypothetical protein